MRQNQKSIRAGKVMEELPGRPYPADHDDEPTIDPAPSKTTTRRVGVLVLAMHRSGSSAITRMLSLLGCALPKTPMPPGFDNPLGHWESQRIADLNDEILSLAGTRWDDWLPVNPRLSETLVWPQLVARGRELLRQEFADAPLFVLKDPRICKLTGFWRDVLAAENVDAAFVLPLRSPIEVARSLLARNGIEEHQGLLIWLRHVLAAEGASRGQPRVFTDYGRLLDDWEQLSAHLSAGLGLVWPRISAISNSEISKFLTSDLRHHVSDAQELENHPAVSPWVREAYKVLLNWTRHGEKPADFDLLDGLSRQFDAAAIAFGRPMIDAGLAVQRAAQAEAERDTASQARAAIAGRLDQIEAEFAQVNRECGARAAERDSLAVDHDAVSGRLGQLEAEFAEVCSERDARAAERDALAGAHGAIAGRLGELEAGLAQVHGERDIRAAERDALTSERDAVLERLGELEAEFTQVGSERDAWKADCDALAGEREAVSLRLDELADEFARVCAERDRRVAERDALAGEQDAAAGQLDELAADLAQVRVERDALASERTVSLGKLTALADERDNVAMRLGEMEAAVARASSDHDARTVERDHLVGERVILADAHDKLVRRLIEVESDLANSSGERIAALARVDRLEKKVDEAQASMAELRHRKSLVESTLRQREEEIAQTGLELREKKTEAAGHAAAAAQAQSEIDCLSVRLAEEGATAVREHERLTRENGIATDRIAGAELENVSLNQQLAQYSAQAAKLAEALHHSTSDAATLRGELHQTQARLDNSITQIAELARLHRDQEQQAGNCRRQAEWLRRLHLMLQSVPQWWAIMPEEWRRRRVSNRLQRDGLFNGPAYLARNPDVAEAGAEPLRHYLLYGLAEGRELD